MLVGAGCGVQVAGDVVVLVDWVGAGGVVVVGVLGGVHGGHDVAGVGGVGVGVCGVGVGVGGGDVLVRRCAWGRVPEPDVRAAKGWT